MRFNGSIAVFVPSECAKVTLKATCVKMRHRMDSDLNAMLNKYPFQEITFLILV